MKVKCLVFDMDGLMFDSEKLAGEMFKKAAKEHGYIVEDSVRFQLLGRSRKDGENILKNEYGDSFPSDAIYTLSAKYKKAYIEEHGLAMKKGLLELLEYGKQNGLKMAVASSSHREVIDWYLEINNITSYFDYLIGGDNVVNSKPNPEIFLKACAGCGVSPKDALVLEDSKSGIIAAVNGGIPVICIPDLVTHDEEVNSLTYAVLPDLSKVIAVLEKSKVVSI